LAEDETSLRIVVCGRERDIEQCFCCSADLVFCTVQSIWSSDAHR